MRQYQNQQNVNAGWVHALPSHWEMRKAKRIFQKKDRVPQENDRVITAFRDGEVTLRANRRTEGFTESISKSNYQRIHESDLVIHSMDAFAGAIGVSDSTGQASPVYVVCRPFEEEEVNVHFYKYLLRHMASSGYIESLAKGIRERSSDFRYSEFATQSLPVPPRSEQDAIADYLDEKTAEIDDYVAKKRKLVDLLKTQRRAVVNRAVTKGLDDDVAMQDSGVEWLGEIPAHWDEIRVRYATSFVTSGSRGWGQYYDKNGHALFVRIGNLQRESLDLDLSDTEYLTLPENAEGKRTRLQEGDVLLSITADIGSVGVVSDDLGEAYVNQHVALTRPRQDLVVPRWMGYALLSGMGRPQLRSQLYGGTKDGLSLADVKDVRLYVPPLAEQKRIVEHIDAKTADIDAAIERTEHQIALMQQYRTSLVTEVVTGAVDVREEAA